MMAHISRLHEDFKGLKTATQKTTITPRNRALFSRPSSRHLPDSQISHLQIMNRFLIEGTVPESRGNSSNKNIVKLRVKPRVLTRLTQIVFRSTS